MRYIQPNFIMNMEAIRDGFCESSRNCDGACDNCMFDAPLDEFEAWFLKELNPNTQQEASTKENK